MGYSVGVFCGSSPDIAPHYLRLAAGVGTAIAERRWTLVSGGEHVSMMGAVAVAARAGGGRTVGVVSRNLLHKADRDADELVITESMSARKAELLARSDALLVLPGGVGTCDEFFEVWTARMVGLHAKPIVVLDVDGFYTGLLAWLGDAHDHGFVRSSSLAAVTSARTVAQALDACAGAPSSHAA
ncbi:cytokinin riboside 5'-monophosphate phosphoribohydrolase [Lentzea sp. NBRC 105346]|uniref:LOG family protein n=1 Tax=Lentzea sp. NBRC 105346 TaxID=3032205 RepID=UPI0024A19E51|nr:TIGR00730 family Rossman fold protein [Lentzea sp. NBRC 105346]GLZ28447.1 cytokinin riboside 5'-monophosphate phosphoribohydrolase [Lentzea sp. NBRC 105346]